jgi:CHASE3 domain sensor protein
MQVVLRATSGLPAPSRIAALARISRCCRDTSRSASLERASDNGNARGEQERDASKKTQQQLRQQLQQAIKDDDSLSASLLHLLVLEAQHIVLLVVSLQHLFQRRDLRLVL